MASKKKAAPWMIFMSIFLAFIIGNLTGTDAGLFGVTFYSLFDLFGTLFIHALSLVVVPLVLSSIVSGVAKIGGDSSFKRLSIKTFGFYVITILSAVLIGLLCANLLAPGNSETLKLSVQKGALFAEHSLTPETASFKQLILSIIPSNILYALSQGEMLALIFFSLLFGYALSKIQDETGKTLQSFFQGLFQVMIQITHLVMKCLPFGVFCLVAKVAATTGLESLSSLALFFTTVLIALSIFSLIVLPLFLKYIGKVQPIRFFKAIAPALITAFSTSSSSATLPITMDCMEKKVGVSNRICSLVIPLGTSLNMAGSALYECVAALFVAQVYGIHLAFSSQIIFVVLALLTSMGVAGIPSASLVAIVIILKAFGLPVEGIGLFLAVDRILDMCRTTVNVLSDCCCATLVAKTEGESGVLSKENF
jgi:Na+/H+-dicarboxylate symporter